MLPAGSVFEATVNEMENGEVLLGLSDGRNVSARLSAGVLLNVGESMFFQVKSNNGMQIEIRPFQTGPEGNPTLLKALDAAGLNVNDKNLTLVNTMMQEQMPIDKSSLMAMVRLSGSHPNVAPATLVEMTKLGLPVTEENAAAFENYKTDQNAMMKELNTLFETLPEMAGNETMSVSDAIAFHKEITAMLADTETAGSVTVKGQEASQTPQVELVAGEAKTGTAQTTEAGAENGASQTAKAAETVTESGAAQTTEAAAENGTAQTAQAAETIAETGTAAQTSQPGGAEAGMPARLAAVLDPAQLEDLKSVYAELSGKDTDISKLTPKQFLAELSGLLADGGDGREHVVRKLFAGKSYQQVLRSALEEEWLLKPQDIRDSGKMNEFYARVDRQMGQLSQILAEAGGNTQTAQAASDLSNNINFMNVLNQTYTYMQIPLKMAHQNAKGDLYVYTNKRKLAEKDGELSAFLHLDMEHLGSTDVSVKMHGKNVGTRFYLSDEASYQVVEAHVPLLQQQLEKLGYQCRIDVENEEKKVDLVDDFLKRDKPAGGMVHRYSFDMRA
ncbi:MAG: flagellar hook-length control protein FliK [Roseburia sp.]